MLYRYKASSLKQLMMLFVIFMFLKEKDLHMQVLTLNIGSKIIYFYKKS